MAMFTGRRVITGGGTHAITASDNGSLIMVKGENRLLFDTPAALGDFECCVKKTDETSGVVTLERADGLPIDGAVKFYIPFTKEVVWLATGDGDLHAVTNWRRSPIVSHRTVTVENLVGQAWSAGVWDIGALIRASCAAVGAIPAMDMMLVLPPRAQLGGPAYRQGGLHIQRVDATSKLVTVFASNNECPINGSQSGYFINGQWTWREFYCDGQQWGVR